MRVRLLTALLAASYALSACEDGGSGQDAALLEASADLRDASGDHHHDGDAHSHTHDHDASTATGDAGKPDAAPAPCTVVSPTVCPTPSPTYADVEPIFKKRCVTCHVTGNRNGYWPLDSYSHVADWFDTVASNLAACTMPPPEANAPIPREESELILAWLKCGYPR